MELNYAIKELNSMLGINECHRGSPGLELDPVYPNPVSNSLLATVSGTLGSMAVTGQAFVEIQPVGHLK